MNWREYSGLIGAAHHSFDSSHKGRMSELFSGRGTIESSCNRAHPWYPRGKKDSEDVNGFRYVDMNYSYFGEESVLVSEASCCVLMVMLDTQSPAKFCAHVSAASDTKRMQWLSMNTDLGLFFKRINWDMNRAVLYMFSDNVQWNEAGRFEHKNIMSLLKRALSPRQIEQLASSSYLIQGENGVQWNPFCAVRLNSCQDEHVLNISFVNPSVVAH